MFPLAARFLLCCLAVKRGRPQGRWQSSPQCSFICICSLIPWYKSEISCVSSHRKLEKKIQSHQLARGASLGCPSKRPLELHKRRILVMLQKHHQKTTDWHFSHTLFFFPDMKISLWNMVLLQAWDIYAGSGRGAEFASCTVYPKTFRFPDSIAIPSMPNK